MKKPWNIRSFKNSNEFRNWLSQSHWTLTIAMSLTSLLNMLLPMVLARILPVEEVGYFRIVSFYFMIFFPLSLVAGLQSGLPFWLANNKTQDSSLAKTAWSATLLLTSFWFLIGILLLPFPVWPETWPPYFRYIIVFIIPASVAGQFAENALIAKGQNLIAIAYTTSFDVVRVALVALLAFASGKTVEMGLIAFAAVSLLRLLTGAIVLARHQIVPSLPRFSELKATLSYALPVSVAGLFTAALSYSDRVISVQMSSPEMFAFYSIGCLSIPPLGIFEQSVNRVLIPKLATLLPSQSSNAIAAFQKSISDLQRILIPATVGLILFSEPIIILLFTEKFKPAADFLKIYALHYILLSLPFDSVLRAQGNGQWILKNAIVGGVATFLFTAIGYKFFSLQGALWGSVFGNALNCFLGIYLSKKQARWSWAEVISAKSFGLYLATSLIIASACHFLRVFFFSETLWFLVCGTLFVPIYFFAVMGIPWLQSKWKHRHATS